MKNCIVYSVLAVFIGLSCQPPSLAFNAILGISSALLLSYVLTKYPITIKSGICFGFVLSAVQFHWVASVFKLFTENSSLVSLLFAVTMYFVASFQFGIFAFLYKKLGKVRWLSPTLHLPLAWAVAELVYPKFIPWSQGATMIAVTPLIKIVDLGGLPLVTFMLFWLATLTTSLFQSPLDHPSFLNKIRLPNLALLTLLVITLWTYSSYRTNLTQSEEQLVKTQNILIIQPNLNQDKDRDYDQLPRRAELLRKITRDAIQDATDNLQIEPDLIFWPESAVGHTFYPEETWLAAVDPRHPEPKLDVPLIFGGQVQLGKVYNKNTKFHNAALVLYPDGRLDQAYYKEKLFPFSEETPLATIFPALERKFQPISNYEKGQSTNTNSIQIGSTIIGLRICFEDIWPHLFRKNVLKDNATLLVSLSNDGWFAETSAMYQHHLLALWRAVENNRYLVRVGNNGISELVSPSGEIVETLPPDQIAFATFSKVPLLENKTLYTSYGQVVFIGIIFVIILIDFLLAMFLPTKNREEAM